MASSALIATLLAQSQKVEENQALVVFGLQNDFVGPNPIVPLPLESGWLDRIKVLIPKFREFAGYIIFVRSEVDSDALKNLSNDKVILDSSDTDGAEKESPSKDDKSPSKSQKKRQKKRDKMAQFLKDLKRKDVMDAPRASAGDHEIEEIYRNLTGNGPAAIPGSEGAAFRSDIQALIRPDEEDIVLVKRNFSAFTGTDLLFQLRWKHITELYLVGCMSNLSVFATAQEAASHGFILNIVEDCMGYRTRKRHDIAMRTMIEHMGAYVTTSSALLSVFEDSLNESSGFITPADGHEAADTEDLTAALSRIGLGESGRTRTPAQSQDLSVTELAEALASSSLNRRSLNSPQQNSISRPPTANASNEPQSPLSSKNLRSSKSTPDIRSRGHVRVRVRKRNEAELPHVPELPKHAALHAKTLSRDGESSKMNQSDPNNDLVVSGEKDFSKDREVTANQRHLSEQRRKQQIPIADLKNSDLDRKHDTLNPDTVPTNSLNPATLNKNKSDRNSVELHEHQTSPNQQHSTSFVDAMKNPLKTFNKKIKSLSNLPSLGPDDVIGEGDSFIKYDLLGKELRDEIDPDVRLSETIFRALYYEVEWRKMYHVAGEVPRLVAVQGAVGKDGSKPVYRHPSDQSPPLTPFTKFVDIVRKEAEKVVGHELNHVLVQLYRSGQDYISEHSDKTLDIKRGSSIVNASFGAQRTMRLRTKRSAKTPAEDVAAGDLVAEGAPEKGKQPQAGVERVTQRIHMPHNSIFVLGLKTNRFWLHGINQDKRAERDRSPEELANNGIRISLTFRLIDTFLSADEKYIWGQGAKSKTQKSAGECINADEVEATKLIDAFGLENKEGPAFDWDEVYGEGSDMLNMKTAISSAPDNAAFDVAHSGNATAK